MDTNPKTIFQGLAVNPSLVDVRAQEFGVFEDVTRIARGLAAAAA